ncbi:hypothetical protein OPV22_018069 [Ensete ventricosum]|uniref:Bifunctional inhibitor/plant lipid transfer protein/seed storage helical domain-containing protein n=1 Tax=Ensete ventricosum TaxID=4639 RepID=A0AAV8QZD2_ENSVE|nr:hypothetical protein OPV22_018069 [Ensete ventricosum]
MGVDFAAGLMAMAVVAAAVAGSAAQSPPDCVSNLMGCAGYLNSTTPPDSCCGPLKQTAKSELPCLCALFNNTALLRTFNVNITQAIQMSKRCGVSIDQRACATATASGTTAAPSSSKNNTGNDSSSGNRATSIGLPGLVNLLLCWWSLMT